MDNVSALLNSTRGGGMAQPNQIAYEEYVQQRNRQYSNTNPFYEFKTLWNQSSEFIKEKIGNDKEFLLIWQDWLTARDEIVDNIVVNQLMSNVNGAKILEQLNLTARNCYKQYAQDEVAYKQALQKEQEELKELKNVLQDPDFKEFLKSKKQQNNSLKSSMKQDTNSSTSSHNGGVN